MVLCSHGLWCIFEKTDKQPNAPQYTLYRQSKFEGSDRQIRSMILRRLLVSHRIHKDELIASIDREPERVLRILQDLCDENLLYVMSNISA